MAHPTIETFDEKAERAQRAVRNFNKISSQMSAFAKMLTGNPKVRVLADSGTPRTDGHTIYMRPPIELGDVRRHDREVCQKRDHRDVMMCLACRTYEEVIITLFHEIGHIAYESFQKVEDGDRQKIILEALREAGAKPGGKRAKMIAEIIEQRNPKNYVEANHYISRFLPVIFNAIEDARVNIETYRARPGTRKMFRGQTIRIFEEGIEQDDGQVCRWDEAPRNAQVIIGLYCKSVQIEYSGWFVAEVEDALDDEELTRLLDTVQTSRDARSIYALGFPVLERLRSLGFCKAPEDVEEEEEEDDTPPPPGNPGEDPDEDGTAEPNESQDEDGEAPSDSPSEGGGSSSGGDSDEGADDDADDDADADEGADADAEGSDADGSGDDDPENNNYDDENEEGGEQGDDAGSDQGDSSGMSDDGGTEGASTSGTGGGSSSGPDFPEDGASLYGDDDEGDEEIDLDRDGDEEAVARFLRRFGNHEGDHSHDEDGDHDHEEEVDENADAVNRALKQAEYFDAPSQNVFGVNVHRWEHHIFDKKVNRSQSLGWKQWSQREFEEVGCQLIEPNERTMSAPLQKLRAIFADNRKSSYDRNRRSGKVHAKVLGRRVAVQDDRIFQKKRLPGKKDYFVVIGMDISGSTTGRDYGETLSRLGLIKSAAYAQAELLSRLGIDFAVYAHTAHYRLGGNGWNGPLDVDMFEIKAARDPWNSDAKKRLGDLTPASGNLDGHTLEFYRKRCDESAATNKIIMYYTDGEMPASNRAEEKAVLEAECVTCKKKNYTLMGVGVFSDSPTQYGMDTVRIEAAEDLPLVVKHLEKRLK